MGESIPCIECTVKKQAFGNEARPRLGCRVGGGIDQNPDLNPFVKGDGGIFVTNVINGSPASLAGLLVGDKLLEVNNLDLTMVSHNQALSMLSKGEEYRLKVTRPGLYQSQTAGGFPPPTSPMDQVPYSPQDGFFAPPSQF